MRLFCSHNINCTLFKIHSDKKAAAAAVRPSPRPPPLLSRLFQLSHPIYRHNVFVAASQVSIIGDLDWIFTAISKYAIGHSERNPGISGLQETVPQTRRLFVGQSAFYLLPSYCSSSPSSRRPFSHVSSAISICYCSCSTDKANNKRGMASQPIKFSA